MKIRKLHIENFQSIKEIDFEFESSGVNYYQGDNNIGKSSIIKAINTLFFNASNQVYRSFIRDDEESFYISMTDFDGNVVELSRGKVDFYRWSIEGDSGEFNRTSGKVPEELREYFNLYFDDKSKECVNIRLPRAVLLGVDTSFSDNNYLLQKALKSEVYTLSYKKADSLKKAHKKEIDVLTKYYEEVKSSIDAIDLEEDRNKITELKRYENTLIAENEKLKRYKYIENLIDETIQTKKELKELDTALEEAYTVEDEFQYFKDLERLNTVATEKVNLESEVKDIEEVVDGINEDIDGISGELDYYNRLRTSLENLEEFLRLKSELKDIEEVVNKDSLIEEGVIYFKDIKNYLDLWESKDALEEELKEYEEDILGLKDELKELETEMGVCPLCGNEFNDSHSHAS